MDNVKREIEEIKVIVDSVLFQDYNFEEDSYFCYLKTKDTEGNKITLKGYTKDSPHSLIELSIKVYGNFTYDKEKNIYVFEFINYNIDVLEFRLFLKMLSLRKKTIESVIQNFTYEEFLTLLEKEHIHELTLIKGIGKKTALKIIKKYKTYRDLKTLTQNLTIFGFNLYDINRIYNYFKENGEEDFENLSLKIILNPYILLKVPKMDFFKIDEIAVNQIGQKSNSLIRIKEGIKYAMKILRNESGNTLLNKDKIFFKSYQITETDKFTLNKELFEQVLKENIKEKEIIEINNRYILKEDLETEKEIYLEIFKKIQESHDYEFLLNEKEALEEIQKFENEEGIKYSKEQKTALLKILTSKKPIMFINGHAGSGKTTVTKAAIKILLKNSKIFPNEAMVCALAGTAANRAKNVIGLPYSKTIHSMIGIIENPKTGQIMTKFNENINLPYKIIIVDESAMIENSLFLYLLKAVNSKKTKIIFIGDTAQLPPVGCGNAFASFIYSDITKDIKIIFNKIFRQKDGALIETANHIREGIVDAFFFEKKFETKDFFYRQYPAGMINEVKEGLIEGARNSIEKYIINTGRGKYIEAISEFQVLTAQKEGFLGVYHINRLIQREVHQHFSPDMDLRFVLVYYVIDFLASTEEKKFFYCQKIKNIMEQIKIQGIKTDIEQKFFQEIEKKINSALKRNVFYYLEKFLRKRAPSLSSYYGYFWDNKYIYREKDRVIHLKNSDYTTFYLDSYKEVLRYVSKKGITLENFKNDKYLKEKTKIQRVYNGQIGIIDAVIPNLGVFVVYPFEEYAVLYKNLHYDTVNLAYSISIHKSQGQEYQKVYMPVIKKHLLMFDNRMLYTAITRAKEKVFIYSENQLIQNIVKRKNNTERSTYLFNIMI